MLYNVFITLIFSIWFNPELQLKYTRSQIRNKLIDLLPELEILNS